MHRRNVEQNNLVVVVNGITTDYDGEPAVGVNWKSS